MKNFPTLNSWSALSLAACVALAAGCTVTTVAPTGGGGNDNGPNNGAEPDGGDGIPDDNIRKVLDTCDGRARNPGSFPNQLVPGDGLHRYTMQSADALCNDGSPAVLYVRAATDPARANDWVIHLQGGGSCFSYEDCEVRWCGFEFYDAAKMSSTFSPITVGARGIHNTDPDINGFARWNHAYFYYCSSDSWGGRSTATVTSEDGSSTYTMIRHGHTIIERAFEELAAGVTSDSGEQVMPDLTDAERVIWSGTSAGSGGARSHADWVSQWLGPETQVAAVLDASVTPSEEFVSDEIESAIDEFARARFESRMTQEPVEPFFDESCAAAAADDELYRCNLAAHVIGNHITTPFFVRMDLRDSQAKESFTRLGASAQEFAEDVRALLLSLQDVQQTAAEGADIIRQPGLYGPNCGQHVGMEVNPWFFDGSIDTPMGGEASFHDALMQWLAGDDVILIDDIDGTLSNCQLIDDER